MKRDAKGRFCKETKKGTCKAPKYKKSTVGPAVDVYSLTASQIMDIPTPLVKKYFEGVCKDLRNLHIDETSDNPVVDYIKKLTPIMFTGGMLSKELDKRNVEFDMTPFMQEMDKEAEDLVEEAPITEEDLIQATSGIAKILGVPEESIEDWANEKREEIARKKCTHKACKCKKEKKACKKELPKEVLEIIDALGLDPNNVSAYCFVDLDDGKTKEASFG